MFDTYIAWVLSHFGLSMFVLALLITLIQRKTTRLNLSELLFRWIAFLPLGVTAIYAFVMHAFFPDFTALTIGWQPSPFQFEVAMANLGLGMLGIFAFNASYGFRLATVIASTCFLWGAAVGHLYQMIEFNNYAISNAGSVFWMDVLVPLILILCLFNVPKKRYSYIG